MYVGLRVCVCVCVCMCFNSLCPSLPFSLYIYAIFKIIINILEFMPAILLLFHLFPLLLGPVSLFLPCHGLFLGFCIGLFILHFFFCFLNLAASGPNCHTRDLHYIIMQDLFHTVQELLSYLMWAQ